MKVALLTGGKDAHYVRGLARQLAWRAVDVVIVGGTPELPAVGGAPGRVTLYDAVGSLDAAAGWVAKTARVLRYYVRLLLFAARTDIRLCHILWFRKFPQAERVLVPLYLKLLGKKIVFTAHNVDDRARDGRDGGPFHAVSLRFLYRVVDHVFVHTENMRAELQRVFGVPADRVSVVPLGINDVIPVADTTAGVAREKLGLEPDARVLLFFGNIAPYKGVEDLIRAVADLAREDDRYLALIVGQVKDPNCVDYARSLERLAADLGARSAVRHEARYVRDDGAGLFFKAADVSVLPYRRVYQSGVLGLSYAQGIPVIASDAGSMRGDVAEGQTGFVFKAGDWRDLAATIRTYFASELYKDLEARRAAITAYGAERFSWTTNAERTCAVYEALAR